jgi:hypothetical protein
MTVPSGRLQFFALEADDYVERLILLAARPSAPSAEEFVRLSRALRGASLMAGLSGFSQAASGLEQVAKAYRDGHWPWTPDNTALVGESVREFGRLARRAEAWTEEDTRVAVQLGRRLVATLAGDEPAAILPPSAADQDELKPGVRAFVGREGALVAGSLEHAAQALELGQLEQAAELVVHRLQPLRGLGALPALSPLPEFLDGIEITIRTFRQQAAPRSGAAGLRQVAGALSRMARDIAERGRTDADAPDFTAAATTLCASFGGEGDVVPIETLFRAGDPSPVVRAGSPAAGRDVRTAESTIELVSLADRFRQAADQMGTSVSGTVRVLQLFGLLMELRPLEREARIQRRDLAQLLGAIVEAIATGAAGGSVAPFAAALREAAEGLSRASTSRNSVLLDDDLAGWVAALRALAPPPPEPAPPAAAAPAVAPVEVETTRPVVPIESLAPDGAPAPTAFERSFSTWFRLEHEAAPIPPARETPRAEPGPVEVDAVPIDTLLYRGRRALERADAVRLDLSQALRARRPFEEIEPLVGELIDLIPLALAE